MNSFALFRQPHARELTLIEQTEGRAQELHSCSDLTGCRGFVVAPFATSARHPIVLIRPDRVERTDLPAAESGQRLSSLAHGGALSLWFEGQTAWELGSFGQKVCGRAAARSHVCGQAAPSSQSDDAEAADYGTAFSLFHAQLLNGRFQKIVLSRSIEIRREEPEPPLQLFLRACEAYPRMFVCLAYTPQSGLWLTATPELLLAGDGCCWHTVALAGTMACTEGTGWETAAGLRWSVKDMEEQRCVATYISRQLRLFTGDVSEEGPHTVRAGHLAHLRSDFPSGCLPMHRREA